MKLYRAQTIERHTACDLDAWVNRITLVDGDERSEVWAVWLPSYGMFYDLAYDAHRWGQRGFLWNLRTGERRIIWHPVEDSATT